MTKRERVRLKRLQRYISNACAVNIKCLFGYYDDGTLKYYSKLVKLLSCTIENTKYLKLYWNELEVKKIAEIFQINIKEVIRYLKEDCDYLIEIIENFEEKYYDKYIL